LLSKDILQSTFAFHLLRCFKLHFWWFPIRTCLILFLVWFCKTVFWGHRKGFINKIWKNFPICLNELSSIPCFINFVFIKFVTLHILLHNILYQIPHNINVWCYKFYGLMLGLGIVFYINKLSHFRGLYLEEYSSKHFNLSIIFYIHLACWSPCIIMLWLKSKSNPLQAMHHFSIVKPSGCPIWATKS